jgi:hypothetical protein
MIKELGRFEYRPDLNRTYVDFDKGVGFLDNYGEGAIKRTLDYILEETVPGIEGEFANLEGFLATFQWVRMFSGEVPGHFNFIAYPQSETTVKRYILNPISEFATNAHQNPDPLVIHIPNSELYLHPKKTVKSIWFPRDNGIVNTITGGFLFKENPLDNLELYPGFKELLEKDTSEKLNPQWKEEREP